MAQCLSEVKRVMGVDAVILHTRTYVIRKWLGFKRREMVEITAGRGLANGPRSRRAPVRPTFVETPPPTYKPMLGAPVEHAAKGRELLETPAGHSAIMVGLSSDVTKLTAMVSDLVTRVRKQESPEVPQELFEEYMQLVQNQVEQGGD